MTGTSFTNSSVKAYLFEFLNYNKLICILIVLLVCQISPYSSLYKIILFSLYCIIIYIGIFLLKETLLCPINTKSFYHTAQITGFFMFVICPKSDVFRYLKNAHQKVSCEFFRFRQPQKEFYCNRFIIRFVR